MAARTRVLWLGIAWLVASCVQGRAEGGRSIPDGDRVSVRVSGAPASSGAVTTAPTSAAPVSSFEEARLQLALEHCQERWLQATALRWASVGSAGCRVDSECDEYSLDMGPNMKDKMRVGLARNAQPAITKRVLDLFKRVKQRCGQHWRFPNLRLGGRCIDSSCGTASNLQMDTLFDNDALLDDPMIREAVLAKMAGRLTAAQRRQSTVAFCDASQFDAGLTLGAWLPADEFRACRTNEKCIPVELRCSAHGSFPYLLDGIAESRLAALQSAADIVRFEERCHLGCQWAVAAGIAYCDGKHCHPQDPEAYGPGPMPDLY